MKTGFKCSKFEFFFEVPDVVYIVMGVIAVVGVIAFALPKGDREVNVAAGHDGVTLHSRPLGFKPEPRNPIQVTRNTNPEVITKAEAAEQPKQALPPVVQLTVVTMSMPRPWPHGYYLQTIIQQGDEGKDFNVWRRCIPEFDMPMVCYLPSDARYLFPLPFKP